MFLSFHVGCTGSSASFGLLAKTDAASKHGTIQLSIGTAILVVRHCISIVNGVLFGAKLGFWDLARRTGPDLALKLFSLFWE